MLVPSQSLSTVLKANILSEVSQLYTYVAYDPPSIPPKTLTTQLLWWTLHVTQRMVTATDKSHPSGTYS